MEVRRKVGVCVFLCFLLVFYSAQLPVIAQDFKATETKIAEYKRWLDSLNSNGSRFWLRLDKSHRPHRLFVGEGFEKADYAEKERFIEIFSHYLAGHPDKFMLIDIYDGVSGKAMGEFGWGGFKLY